MTLGGKDIVDWYLQLERRVARLERTSSTANSQDDVTYVGLLTVTGLNVQSQTVVPYGTDSQVYVNMAWTDISVPSDVITDDPPIGYYTSFTKDGTNYTSEAYTDGTTAMIGPLAMGQTITFAVRAVTLLGTLGPYATTSFSTTLDNAAPGQPSTPTATPYLGQVRIFWDGKAVGGGAMPADLVVTEIHMATSNITFTPTASTIADTFYPGGGFATITDLDYGVTYYFRLVAVDKVGNRSVVSTGVSVVPVQAADGDIASMSIGKLTVGNLSADLTVAARIKTANTGARVELNSSGLQAYNSSNVLTVNISASTGTAVVTGTIQTGTTGSRILMDPSGFPTLYFYPSSGANYSFINAAADILGLNSQLANSGGTQVKTRLMLGATSAVWESVDEFQSLFGGRIIVSTAGVFVDGTSGKDIFLSAGSGDLDLSGTLPSTGNPANLSQNGGSIARNGSSRILKTVIEGIDNPEAIASGLDQLRPVTFYDKRDYEAAINKSKVWKQIGLIAEEVEEIPGPVGSMLHMKFEGPNGTELPAGVAYERLPVLLLVDRALVRRELRAMWEAIEELQREK